MNREQQLDQIEMTMEQAREDIALKDAIVKMDDNPEWERIILNGYFKEEAARLVALKAEYHVVQDESIRADVDNCITAIGYFRRYLHTAMQKGYTAESALQADEETREELLSEML